MVEPCFFETCTSQLTLFQLKRQHSFDGSTTVPSTTRKQSSIDDATTLATGVALTSTPTIPSNDPATTTPSLPGLTTPRLPADINPSDIIGSPFKKHRASVVSSDFKLAPPGAAGSVNGGGSSSSLNTGIGLGLGLGIQQELPAEAGPSTAVPGKMEQSEVKMEADEEL